MSCCDAAFPDPPQGEGGSTESVDPAQTPKQLSNGRNARDTPQSAEEERGNSHQGCSSQMHCNDAFPSPMSASARKAQSCNFEQLASSPSSTVHMGSQAGKAYRIVLEEHGTCYSVLALLLAFVTPSRKRKGDESPSEKLRRLSSPRHWDVALVPFPEDFVPLPTPTETGLACPAPWAFPPSLCVLESRATKFRVLAIAEAGDTVTADHLLQMASLAAEHKPTALGIPGQVPIPYQLECTVVLLQSLHALFQLLTSGNTMQHCPQAASFAVALGTAARQDNGHIVSMASSLALALRSGRSTLAVAGVFGAGKTRSLTFLLAWLALTTHLKIAVVHKENPAGRAITKLLTAFDLEPDHQRYFIRPVSREEAETNTACTDYDLRASDAASYIPGCHVVIVTTGLVWDQKGQTHSTLNTHMENVDLLISEEAQQDMDLKSAFAPTVPRQPFFRLLLGDPKQSPGGVADGQRAHRTLLLKAPIGLRAPTTWYMPHEIPGVFHMLLRHGRGFGLSDLEETAKVVGHRPLGSSWFRPEGQSHVFVRLSVTVHLQRPLQSGSGSPGRTAGGSRICSYQPGQPARLPTGAKCGREIRSCKPALLEFNVANERKGCPRSIRAVNRNSVSHVAQPNGRHLANRYHLHSRGSLDCLRPTICPLVPCFAQCAGKAKPKE